jgi:hypothetical protein
MKIRKINVFYRPSNWITHTKVIHQKVSTTSRKNLFEILEPLINVYKAEISNLSMIDDNSIGYFKHDF